MQEPAPALRRRPLGARLAEWGRVASINLGVLLRLTVVGEFAFGTWIFGPNLGILNVNTNVHLLIVASPYYPPGAVAHYNRDRYGLRGEYGGEPARIGLLAVGGSTTNEIAVGDDDAWTSVLRRMLRARGRPLVVANAGVDGHSTAGHIRSFDLWFAKVPGLKPRYILFYIGANDRGIPPDTLTGPDSLAHDSAYRRLRAFVENNSAIVRAVRTVRGWLAARRIGVRYGSGGAETGGTRWVPARVPPGLAERLAPNLRGYRERLQALHAKALAFGATPIYVTQRNGDGRLVAGVMQEDRGERRRAHLRRACALQWRAQALLRRGQGAVHRSRRRARIRGGRLLRFHPHHAPRLAQDRGLSRRQAAAAAAIVCPRDGRMRS